jgi:hypothetical protein
MFSSFTSSFKSSTMTNQYDLNANSRFRLMQLPSAARVAIIGKAPDKDPSEDPPLQTKGWGTRNGNGGEP